MKNTIKKKNPTINGVLRNAECYEVAADIGSLRIDTPDAAFFFNNGYGDGKHLAYICRDKVPFSVPLADYATFQNVCEIKTKATISAYDCANAPVCELGRGRWGVYSSGGTTLVIYWDDQVAD
ncbi:MAG TPA: hypothetical protein VME66_13720 [Candidatus Acidoferrales bacterium]|nr:hypothetical protein [Candidatus Acidoferrales bacterium]